MPGTCTVFLAPDGADVGVADVLADLSAAGLLRPYAWISATQLGAPTAEAVVVDGGRRHRVALQRWLAEHPPGSIALIRIAVVVPVGASAQAVSVDQEQELLRLVRAGGGPMRMTPVRCLVARPGDAAPSSVIGRHGWHNVLVSPEEARGPDQPRVALAPSSDPVDVGRYAGPVIAGVLGLWTGDDHSPLDEKRLPDQPWVRAARAFYRHVDAEAIERELRASVLSTRTPLPLPRDHLGPTEHLADPTQACADMAQELWNRHHRLLIGDRVRPAQAPVLLTGAWAALKMLLAYLWGSLRNLPSDLVAGAQNRGSALAARRVQGLVFGSEDSAYKVVAGGIVDDLPAGWRDTRRESGRLEEQISGARAPARPDLTRMWEDYVGGALTLCDAGDRGMPPATIGQNRAVLRTVEDCVPTAERDFDDVPGHIAARTGVRQIQPGDVLAADELQVKLQVLARDHGFGQDAGQVGGAVEEWRRRHAHTYSVRVGTHLARAVYGTIDEIRRYLDIVLRAAQEPVEDQADDRRRTVIGRILFALGVIGIGTGVTLGVLGVVGTVAATLIAVVPILVWFVFVAVSFVRARRESFRDLHRRRTLLNESDAARVNLERALVDLQRLADAYDQYLVWSRVLGAVLRSPYGVLPPQRTAAADLARGLPLTTRVARAGVDPRATGAAANTLRSDVFARGWLSRPWQDQLLGAAARLNRYDMMDRPGDIVDLRAVAVQESVLAQWADLLARDGTDPTVGDGIWRHVLATVDGPRAVLGEALLSSVREVGDDDRGPTDLPTFLSRVDQPASGPNDRFAPEMFTDAALAQEHARIDVHESRGRRIGLSRVVTLVQMGEPWPPEEFTVTSTRHRAAQPPPVIPPMPDLEPVHAPDPYGPARTGNGASPAPDGTGDRPHDVPPAPPGLA